MQPDRGANLQRIAELLRYPKDWDTAAYPTIFDAMIEVAGTASTRIQAVSEDALIDSMGALLDGVAVALRGPHPEDGRHSYHDLPERAAAVVAERDAASTGIERLKADLVKVRNQGTDALYQLTDCDKECDTLREQVRVLVEALELALSSHGVLLMSDPPQDAWKVRGVDAKLRAAALEHVAADRAKPVIEHEPDVKPGIFD
jgi:hypothetical protein